MAKKRGKVDEDEFEMMLPGMEDYAQPVDTSGEEDIVFDQLPSYFDAANLPDAPDYQPTAAGESFIIYWTFPTQELMRQAIEALTFGERASVPTGSKFAAVNGMHKGKTGVPMLYRLRKLTLGVEIPDEYRQES